MGGGGRTLFYGLVGILIALSTAFVLHRIQQQRMQEQRTRNIEPTGSPHGRPPPNQGTTVTTAAKGAVRP